MDSWIPESVRRKKYFFTGTPGLTSGMTKKTKQLLGITSEGVGTASVRKDFIKCLQISIQDSTRF